MRGPVLSLAVLVLFATCLTAQAASPSVGIDPSAMDTSVAPGDDFDEYANGAWLKRTTIPADRSSWNSFNRLDAVARARTRALIEQAQTSGNAESRKAGDFYFTFMDEAGIEARGFTPIRIGLDAIAALADKRALSFAIGKTLRADVDPLNATNFVTGNLFGIWVAPGFNDSAHYTAYLLQGGLGMPSRDYYLDASDRMKGFRTAYQAYVATVLRLAGITDAERKAAGILDLETRIARAQETLADNEDVAKADNLWHRADFAGKAPGLDWDQFFAGAELSQIRSFMVWQPAAVTGLSALVGSEPLETWKAWLIFHRLDHFSAVLPEALVDAHFAFHDKTLSGTLQMEPRWQRGVHLTNDALGDAVGRLYAARYFPPAVKARAQAMVRNITAAWGRRVDALTWMTPGTKAKAKEKLFAIYAGIGYPETWRDYSVLEVENGDAFGNQLRAELFEYHRNIGRLGKPVDRHEWAMEPQTVNALNLPLQNALNFPAAILDRPFFDAAADDAYNYGAIGAVIGHEISHTFDNEGAAFDTAGELHNWWTPADFAHFKDSAKALVAQYSGYRPFSDLAVNGEQTLSENIADNAGLMAAYDAWHTALAGKPAPAAKGFSGEQEFFLAFAQVWARKVRESAERQGIMTDGHAPAEFRLLEVRNVDGWYAAFGVKPGQKEYLAPAARVHVW